MRGRRQTQTTMLAFVDLEERVPRNNPLRATIKQFADRALAELSLVFNAMCGGWPTVHPARAAAQSVAADCAVLGA